MLRWHFCCFQTSRSSGTNLPANARLKKTRLMRAEASSVYTQYPIMERVWDYWGWLKCDSTTVIPDLNDKPHCVPKKLSSDKTNQNYFVLLSLVRYWTESEMGMFKRDRGCTNESEVTVRHQLVQQGIPNAILSTKNTIAPKGSWQEGQGWYPIQPRPDENQSTSQTTTPCSRKVRHDPARYMQHRKTSAKPTKRLVCLGQHQTVRGPRHQDFKIYPGMNRKFQSFRCPIRGKPLQVVPKEKEFGCYHWLCGWRHNQLKDDGSPCEHHYLYEGITLGRDAW